MDNLTNKNGVAREELLKKVSAQFFTSDNQDPPMKIYSMHSVAWAIFYNWGRARIEDIALVNNYGIGGNEIGIAIRGEKGFVPTSACVDDDPAIESENDYRQAAIDWFNTEILGHSVEDAAVISISTMSF